MKSMVSAAGTLGGRIDSVKPHPPTGCDGVFPRRGDVKTPSPPKLRKGERLLSMEVYFTLCHQRPENQCTAYESFCPSGPGGWEINHDQLRKANKEGGAMGKKIP